MAFRKPLVKTEKLVEESWVEVPYESIKKGDVFRTYVDAEGTKLSQDDQGHTKFIAKEDAYSENGFHYTISCEPVK